MQFVITVTAATIYESRLNISHPTLNVEQVVHRAPIVSCIFVQLDVQLGSILALR